MSFQHPTGNDSLSILPDEILINEILPKLAIKDLSAACSGNSRFRRLCNNEQLWQNKVRLEYSDVNNKKPKNMMWRDFYSYLTDTRSIPVLVEDDYIGNARIDPNNLRPTVNNILKHLNAKKDEPLSFIFLWNRYPVTIYYHPRGEFVPSRMYGKDEVPDRLYIVGKRVFYNQIEAEAYPYIYAIPKLHTNGMIHHVMVGDKEIVLSGERNKKKIIGILSTLKVPLSYTTLSSEINRTAGPKEEWNRYSINELYQILQRYLEKTGRWFN